MRHITLAAMAAVTLLIASPAFAYCDTDSAGQNCWDRTKEATKKVFTGGFENSASNAAEAGKTAGDCIKCATTAVGTSLGSFKTWEDYKDDDK